MKEPSHDDPTVSIIEPPVYTQEELFRLYGMLCKDYTSLYLANLFFADTPRGKEMISYTNKQFKKHLKHKIDITINLDIYRSILQNIYKYLYQIPIESLPLHINTPGLLIKEIVKWRLEIGK